MRVIAGAAKGLRLKTLKGSDKRPTTDRVKESMFATIGEKVLGAEAMDLFAGTGNLGIEALSRGARAVLFVDRDVRAKRAIEENLRATQLLDRAEIWMCDVFATLQRLRASRRMFDLIFADPPYGKGYGERTLLFLGEGDILREEGMFVLEHATCEEVAGSCKGMKAVSERIFGQTVVHFFRCLKIEE
ncbi:MAG: 16S rRNA (guanine(966)-N(2))-methyltransferase RsmD [bacterium]